MLAKNSKNRLLFLSHDDTRTGAPILLLNLARVLKKSNYRLQIDFLIKKTYGELLPDFKREGKVFSFELKPNKFFLKRIIDKSKEIEKILRALALNENYDFILLNTITNGDIISVIKKNFNGPIVTYVHELQMASSHFSSAEYVSNVINCSDLFFVPSEAVRDFLVNTYDIADSRIRKLPYFIPPVKFEKMCKEKDVTAVFTIGGCGTLDWRKGVDVFLIIALRFFTVFKGNNIKFKWKGAKKSIEYDRIIYELKKSGLEGKVEFLPVDDNVNSFFEDIDLFILPSREDPFPLVVLEAAAHGVPTVCFHSAGGAEEFVCDDAGVVVNFLDIEAIVGCIISYLNDNIKLKKHGKKAFEKVLENHSEKVVVESFFSAFL